MKLWIIFISTCLFYCTGGDTLESPTTHIVLFSLREPTNTAHQALIAKEIEKFKAIPDVLSVKLGKKLIMKDTIKETNFDLVLTMEFSSRKAMENYIKNPIHIGVNNKLKPLLKDLKVYNFPTEQ